MCLHVYTCKHPERSLSTTKGRQDREIKKIIFMMKSTNKCIPQTGNISIHHGQAILDCA